MRSHKPAFVLYFYLCVGRHDRKVSRREAIACSIASVGIAVSKALITVTDQLQAISVRIL